MICQVILNINIFMPYQFPISNKLELELTSKCTVKCPNCPRTYQADRRHEWDNGNIKEEHLIDFLSNNIFVMRLKIYFSLNDSAKNRHCNYLLEFLTFLG